MRISGGLLAETFATLRECGGGRRECVAYWLGPASVDDLVDELVHPVHTASSVGYQIDDRWLTAFWLDLARRGKTVRVQVHSHPGGAGHSHTDDEFALVHTTGFLSLVLPSFAAGPTDLRGAHLAERVPGGWRSVSPRSRLEIEE